MAALGSTAGWPPPAEGASVTDPAVTELAFDTGVVARLATVDGSVDPARALAALGIPRGRPTLVLCGGAASLDDDIVTRAALAPVLGPGMLAAAADAAGVIIDGGTDAGVVSLLGQAASRVDAAPPMLGVAPAALVMAPGRTAGQDGAVRLEPHHRFFVLTPGGAWGDETPWLTALAAATAGSQPVVMVVAGGGSVSVAEVREAVRRGWTVVVLADTGGLAQELAAWWRRVHLPQRRGWPARLLGRASRAPEDAAEARAGAGDEFRRLVEVGRFRLVPAVDAADLATALAWELRPRPVLAAAWDRFARYDQAAVRLRRSFERSQLTILALGLAATLLALLLHGLDTPLREDAAWVATTLHWSVVALPLLAGVLIAFADRFAFGKRWVLLRGAAETIKSEIYRYRTGTGIYAESAPGTPSPERRLAVRLAAVDTRLFDTEVSAAELPPYAGVLPPPESWIGSKDDGFSHLSVDRFVDVRAGDQISFYQSRTGRHGRKLRIIQGTILLAAAAGAFVAAVGQEIWVGFTTALATAFAMHRSYLQLDATVVAYNQAASRLENLVTHWKALPAEARASEYGWLVEQTEAVLQTELGGWVQQMNEALQSLQRQQAAQRREADAAASQRQQSEAAAPGPDAEPPGPPGPTGEAVPRPDAEPPEPPEPEAAGSPGPPGPGRAPGQTASASGPAQVGTGADQAVLTRGEPRLSPDRSGPAT
jgi:hypothetical protein